MFNFISCCQAANKNCQAKLSQNWPSSKQQAYNAVILCDVISSHFVFLFHSLTRQNRSAHNAKCSCEGVFVNSRMRSRSFRPFCCSLIGRGLFFFFPHNSRSHFTIILVVYLIKLEKSSLIKRFKADIIAAWLLLLLLLLFFLTVKCNAQCT